MRFTLSWFLCALLLACGPSPPEVTPVTPAAPEAISLHCFSFHSTVVFAALPDSPQVLEATYQGTEHAHWWFGKRDDPSGSRRLRYRSGDMIYAIEPGSGISSEYVASEHAAAMLQFELRRALMLWPDGFDWQTTDRGREFELQDGSGRLFVEIEQDHAVRFYSRNQDGVELESFSDLQWQEFSGRSFPKEATLSVGGTKVWTETLDRIIPDCEYVSFFFLPPDRRSSAVSAANQTGGLRHLDLPERFTRRTPLEAGLSWSTVKSRGSELLSEACASLPGLEPRIAFAVELDESALPRAILLLLDVAKAQMPKEQFEQWTQHDPGPALSVLLAGLDKLTPGMLQGLGSHLPEGSQAGPYYLRLPPIDEPDLPAQLVMTVESN